MSRSFWSGVAAGAAGTVAGLRACGLLNSFGRTVRVDRSIQIERPPAEVFSAWARVERIPQFVRSVVSVVSCEDISVWVAEFQGRRFEWDVEILQVVPKQVIGWKSHRGPRHSGRISFFPIGEDTLLLLEMNYVPGINLGNFLGRSNSWDMGDAIEAALRDFKAMLESTHPRWAAPPLMHETPRDRATGTYGPEPVHHNPGREELETRDGFERPPGTEYP
jgi:uncharacterized membrane protein